MADPETLVGAEAQEDERPWEKPGGVRRDCEPHRSSLLLFLGTVSLVGAFLSCLILPGIIAIALGGGVWAAATYDLKKMRAGIMDPAGEPRTLTARECATGAGLVLVLYAFAFIALVGSLAHH
jgi:hypothetical protein